MLDRSRELRSRRRRIVDRSEEGMGPTRNGRTNVGHQHAIAAGDPRLLGDVRAHFQRARNLSADSQVSMARPCPMAGRRTGGAIMNKAVMKLPLMLGVVGAIAFAAAMPSWAAEKSQNAGAGMSAQTGSQTKATGSSMKMSSGTHAKPSTARAASTEGMRTGHMSGQKLSKSSKLSDRTR